MQSSNFLSRLRVVRTLLVRHGIYVGLGVACCAVLVAGLALALGSSTAGYAFGALGLGMAMGWAIT